MSSMTKGDFATNPLLMAFLIKDGKTKMNCLMKSINGYGYITWYVTHHKMDKYFVKIR